MGDVVNLHGQPVAIEDDHDFITDMARFADGLLSEEAVKKKYRLAESTWGALGNNDALVEKIEAEKVRRIRDGSTKRERAQIEVVDAPPILAGIMRDPNANERHRIDSIKVLDGLAANGPESAPAADRFVITINLTADGSGHIEHFNKSIAVDPNDVDPNDIDVAPQDVVAAIATNKPNGGNDGEPL